MPVLPREIALAFAADLRNLPGWSPGVATAGLYVRDRKQNQQLILPREHEVVHRAASAMMGPQIVDTLGAFQLQPPRFSHYVKGDHYGWHVDSAMSNDKRWDMSFSMLLEAPKAGGSLQLRVGNVIVDIPQKEGDCAFWASHLDHRVTPVEDGERIVALSLATCAIEDPIKREILARQSRVLRATVKAGIDVDDATFVYTNAMRMWTGPYT